MALTYRGLPAHAPLLQAGAALLGAVLLRRKATLWQSPGNGGAKVLAAQQPPRYWLLSNLAAITLSGYAAHKLGFVELAHDQRLCRGEWEEVPFSGRLRPAMPALTEREQLLRDPAYADLHSSTAVQQRGARYVTTYA